ncbi:phytanoyl-CoA dioxygenase family protein [Bowmanella denitrificans]|uniref:Phytanoyl-CoA dioxygenase family protein n=1 Tax=Bowmanella denitrificans TaxID=366582 RepID=A0ABN0XKP2_9ALTE
MFKSQLDLTFKNVTIKKGAVLTEDQIKFYNDKGYVKPIRIYDEIEMEEINSYIESLLSASAKIGRYGLNCYHSKLQGVWDIATNSRILDCVEDILGEDIICWASAVVCKNAHSSKVIPWHQDAVIWNLTPARTVNVWLALDDADVENGAMQWIPGSHKKGPVKIDSEFSSNEIDINLLETNLPQINSLKAGECSIHADMLVHGSPANLSSRRRCAIVFRYCSPDVRSIDEKWAEEIESIICRGQDESGYWRHHPRPLNNDLAKVSESALSSVRRQ